MDAHSPELLSSRFLRYCSEGIITSNIAFIHSPIYILSGYPYHTRETVMSTVEENMRLMQTLDDAWNTQDWATFEKRHAKEVDVFWPGQAEPTHGRPSHKEEAVAFFKIFPDNKVGNRPVQDILRTGRLHLLGRRVYRHLQRPDDHPGRENNPAQREEVQR